MIGRELVYSTRYDANRKASFEVHFYTGSVLFYKNFEITSDGAPLKSVNQLIGKIKGNAEIKKFSIFSKFFRLLEARGEGESRARIRCLPVRQSKSDSKMG